MDWLASGALQTWVMDVLTNNAKLIGLIYGILKYFAVTLGDKDKNRILDLIKK